jgi:putative peptidoglycan lipid II flippase
MSEPVATISIQPESPVQRAAEAEAASPRAFVGHAKLIGAFTLASRVLGLAREVVAVHFLGTKEIASAFTVAFTIPNLFRKLFGEGALSAAFIPLYAQAVKTEQQPPSPTPPHPDAPTPPHSSASFAAASVNVLCVILIVITLLGEGFLTALLLLKPDMRPDRALTIKLAMIMLPYVLLICGTALLGGVLQVHRRFAAPAAAPILLNVCHIVVIVLGAAALGLRPHDPDAARVARLQTTLCYWLAAFVLVGGVLQVLILLPSLRAVGFRFQPAAGFRTPLVRKMLRLTVPVALGAGVLQLSVLLDKGISTMLMQGVDEFGNVLTHFTLFGHSIRYPMEAGAPARLNLAQYLYQFPLGVFAIALATAIFPSLSSEALDGDGEKFRSVLRTGIEASLWEGIPASVGLVLVGGPAIRLLFQHGRVTAHDAELIQSSLLFYAGGIWAFSLLQIVNRAYYAVHDTVTPLVMSVVNIVLNLVVEIPLLWWLGEPAMALGTLVSFAVQAIVMLWMLDRRIGPVGLGGLAKPVGKILLATAVMAGACWAVKASPLYPRGETRTAWLGQLVLLIGVGAAVYVGVCHVLGMRALEHVLPKRKRA